MSMLKSSRAYIFISDIGFIKRNGYFLKERIQIVSMKWPVNIKTYLQFLDYRKFCAHPFTYFILSLLNSRPTSKFYKPTRLFVQVCITFLRFEIQARNNEYYVQMTSIITKCHERKRKKFSVILSRTISCYVTTYPHGSCNESLQ